jgi:hypothetical protein
MSADNGVYILESKGPEWRVAYAHGIDKIILYSVFKNSPTFNIRDHAEMYAEGLADQHLYLEYGILLLETYRNMAFEDLKNG